jgi:hypothetical protein
MNDIHHLHKDKKKTSGCTRGFSVKNYKVQISIFKKLIINDLSNRAKINIVSIFPIQLKINSLQNSSFIIHQASKLP